MQLQTLLVAALAAVPAFSAPAPAADKSMMAAADAEWTITSFVRTCNSDNTSCDYSFSIDTHTAAATPCSYTVTGDTASRASYSGEKCGAYTISSNWSGQFGVENGFQTLAVTDNQLIIYPAYTDKQLVNGQVVVPDQSYAPQNLP